MEPGMVVCSACGANQVTGVVHRPRPKTQEVKPHFWSGLPVRSIMLVVVVVAVVFGVYRVINSVGKSAAATAERLVYERMVAAAAKYLRDGGDVSAFGDKFGAQVTGDNLPGLVATTSVASGQVVAKSPAPTVYDTTGTNPRVADCAAVDQARQARDESGQLRIEYTLPAPRGGHLPRGQHRQRYPELIPCRRAAVEESLRGREGRREARRTQRLSPGVQKRECQAGVAQRVPGDRGVRGR